MRFASILVAWSLVACTVESPSPEPVPSVAPGGATSKPPEPVADDRDPQYEALRDEVEPTPLPEAGPPPAAAPRREPAALGLSLADAGAEPRHSLRSTAARGATQALTLQLGMRMAMQLGERAVPATDVPAVAVDLDLNVDKAGSTLDFAFDIPAVRVGEVAQASPRLAAAVVQTGARIDALSGTGSLAPGRGPELTLDGGEPTGPTEPTLQGLFDALGALLVAVPAEAVGVGGKWTVVTSASLGGLPIQRAATYTVTALDEASVTLSIAWEEYAVTGPGSAAGDAQLTARAHTATGTGELTLRRDEILPGEGHFVANGRTHAAVTVGGGAQTVVTDLGLDARLGARAP